MVLKECRLPSPCRLPWGPCPVTSKDLTIQIIPEVTSLTGLFHETVQSIGAKIRDNEKWLQSLQCILPQDTPTMTWLPWNVSSCLPEDDPDLGSSAACGLFQFNKVKGSSLFWLWLCGQDEMENVLYWPTSLVWGETLWYQKAVSQLVVHAVLRLPADVSDGLQSISSMCRLCKSNNELVVIAKDVPEHWVQAFN